MSNVAAFGYVVLGVFLSLVIPILRQYAFPPPTGGKGFGMSAVARFLEIAKPYLFMAALSLAFSVVTLAIAKSENAVIQYWYQAFLLGYFYDSTIQKFKM